MRILAVDQSYNCSGICLMDDMELLECQKYSAPKNDDTFYRAQQVADELLYICDMFDPDIVAAMFDALGVKKTTGLMDLTDAYFIGVCAHNDV